MGRLPPFEFMQLRLTRHCEENGYKRHCEERGDKRHCEERGDKRHCEERSDEAIYQKWIASLRSQRQTRGCNKLPMKAQIE